ncbi:MAG: hypothetical protein IJD84_01535 [Parabacteroides sp.]|nr:hypothetical protein [Parabacteroides sp.]
MKKIEQESLQTKLIEEPSVMYQRRSFDNGVTRLITQAELDAECFTLAESKKRLIEKIYNHYHKS